MALDNFTFTPSSGVNDTVNFPAKDPAIRAHLQALLDQVKDDLNNVIRDRLKQEVGSIREFIKTTAPNGFLILDGSLKSRTVYADLWNFASNSGLLISDSAWTAGDKGKFSTGDGSTTFRLPDFQTGNRTSRAGGGSLAVGTTQEDDIKAHTHPTTYMSGSGSNYVGAAPTNNTVVGTNSVLVQSTGGTETRMKNIATLWCIRY